MLNPVALAEDRSLAVPPGRLIRTGYVSVWACRFACRERMAIGDMKTAFERRLQLGDHQRWPCPRGEWDGDEFVIIDGRHELLSAIMVGQEHILVAWPEPTDAC